MTRLGTLAATLAMSLLLPVPSRSVEIDITVTGGVYLSAVSSLLPVANGSTAVNTTIPNGSSAVLTWDSANGATSCTGTGFSTGGAVSGTVTVSPTVTTTYTVACGAGSTSATVTVSGNLIDAAATYCAGHGGGDGSSGSPWTDACINAAVAAASNGDTIFLAAGNWGMAISTGMVTNGGKSLHLVGAGSGNTFTAQGNPITSKGTDLCPTTTSSGITCVYPTGTKSTSGPGGGIEFTGTGAACNNVSASRMFLDISTNTGGGDFWGILTFQFCDGPMLVDDIKVLTYVNNDGFSAEAPLFVYQNPVNPFTIQNSQLAAPPGSGSFFSNDGPIIDNTSTSTLGDLAQNNYFYESAYNPILAKNMTVLGNVFFQANDGGQFPGIRPGVGMASAGLNPFIPQLGTPNWSAINNFVDATGQFFGIGGGGNDPGGGGDQLGLIVKGNTIVGQDVAIDSCTYHYYDYTTGKYQLCWGASPVTSASWSSASGGQVTYVLASTPNVAAAAAGWQVWTSNFLPSGYNSPGSGRANPQPVVSNTCSAGVCTIVATEPNNIGATATTPGYIWVASAGTSVGMQINGTVDSSCVPSSPLTPNFSITNNSVIGTSSAVLDATGTGVIKCSFSFTTGDFLTHISTVSNFDASTNYLSSPHNLYLTDSLTINPVVSNNVGAGTNGQGAMDVAAASFTQNPTVSFTLGTLSNGKVSFASTNFTAQYGAVSWIASTSSTTPTSGDARWSYVPPVSLSPVAHGNIVYMWVMDSANHISSAASAPLP